jgi:hypothetical protein
VNDAVVADGAAVSGAGNAVSALSADSSRCAPGVVHANDVFAFAGGEDLDRVPIGASDAIVPFALRLDRHVVTGVVRERTNRLHVTAVCWDLEAGKTLGRAIVAELGQATLDASKRLVAVAEAVSIRAWTLRWISNARTRAAVRTRPAVIEILRHRALRSIV